MDCDSCRPAKPQQKPFSAGALSVRSHRCPPPCPPPRLSRSPATGSIPGSRRPARGRGFHAGAGEKASSRAWVGFFSPEGTGFCWLTLPWNSRLRGEGGGAGGWDMHTFRRPAGAPTFRPCPRWRGWWQLLHGGICCSAFQRCILAALPAVGCLVVAPIQEGVKPVPVEQLRGCRSQPGTLGTPPPAQGLVGCRPWPGSPGSGDIGAAGRGTSRWLAPGLAGSSWLACPSSGGGCRFALGGLLEGLWPHQWLVIPQRGPHDPCVSERDAGEARRLRALEHKTPGGIYTPFGSPSLSVPNGVAGTGD